MNIVEILTQMDKRTKHGHTSEQNTIDMTQKFAYINIKLWINIYKL